VPPGGTKQPFKASLRGRALGQTDAATSVRMAGVRQSSTSAEMIVRRIAHSLGLRYRLSNRDLPGSPDIANRSRRWVVFVHGCFWHRHAGCPRTTTPKRNRRFWTRKFEANVERDARCQAKLLEQGWRVLVVWECDALAAPKLVARRLRSLRSGGLVKPSSESRP
jgi:DNA mismatch endonuclease, patch repair protein